MRKFWVRAIVLSGNLHRRFLAALFGIVGPDLAYRITALGAKAIYALLQPLRVRSEAQCRAALKDRVAGEDIAKIAKASFVHRAWNLTDLLLAPRLLHAGTFQRYGGAIPERLRSELLAGQRARQPTILVTGYIGSFDLLPIFLGYNGIQATAVYLPHGNKGYDDFRRRIRAQSGCELVPLDHALPRIQQVLGAGGTVALLADHHSGSRGVSVPFLGLETKVTRAIGLLAWRHQANVVVAAIRRVKERFHFEWVVADVIYYAEAAQDDNVVEAITRRYVQGLEKIVLEDPSQYLWAYPRWGEAFAGRAAALATSPLEKSTVAG